jgi:hypothetical protein
VTDIDRQAASAPSDVYRLVAAAQAQRWGYTKTLDAAELAAYILRQSEDHNVRSDADVVWREALRQFQPRLVDAITDGIMQALAKERAVVQPAIAALDGALHSVWLHGDWRWLTSRMTTEQREAAAEAVERHSAALNADAVDEFVLDGDDLRWWRT